MGKLLTMKILLANNFYYYRGGDCTYLFALKNLLEKNGHEVPVFSMHHPQNFPTEFSDYFVSYINYADELEQRRFLSGLKVLSRSIYSREAKANLDRLIRDVNPDIVHLNNIRHHITPSVLSVINKYDIPVVWTLHDYQLICPNISFLAEGKICEKCRSRRYFWPPIMKCKKGSFLASTMAALEHSIHSFARVYRLVDTFVCPSKFLMQKFQEYDFYREKLVLQHYFIDTGTTTAVPEDGGYILYVGRLSQEKGLFTLIDAVMDSGAFRLKIVGDGPLMNQLTRYVDVRSGNRRVELLGQKRHADVIKIIAGCSFLIIPSEWYEVTGQVIFEAFACGKTVIGSRIGGIPEFIREGETGLLFAPGNARELSEKIRFLMNNKSKMRVMGEAGKTFIQEEMSPERHYEGIMNIYQNALDLKKEGKKGSPEP